MFVPKIASLFQELNLFLVYERTQASLRDAIDKVA